MVGDIVVCAARSFVCGSDVSCFGSEDGLAGVVLVEEVVVLLGRRYRPVHCERKLKTDASLINFSIVTQTKGSRCP